MDEPARPRIGAILVAGAALILGFALAGCPDKKPRTPACKTDKECSAGLVCVENKCAECGDDSQCPKGERCSNNACVAAPECTRDDQCPAGKVCQAGSCKTCASDNECGPGGTCNAGACQRAKKCGKDEDCADDEDCKGGYCLKANRTTSAADGACPLQTVYFAFDQSVIQESERDRLAANAACIEKTKGKIVVLGGHTDTSGTEEYNIALSERRAQSVADYLSRLGTDPARMQVVPKGETEPLGMGDDKDRRVEFVWK
jgi:peptidoglycan-associated lipoprotein